MFKIGIILLYNAISGLNGINSQAYLKKTVSSLNYGILNRHSIGIGKTCRNHDRIVPMGDQFTLYEPGFNCQFTDLRRPAGKM
jgi:hypothetical protein